MSSKETNNNPGVYPINPLNAKLNSICHLLVLLGAHLILHISRISVKGQSRRVYRYTLINVRTTDVVAQWTVLLHFARTCGIVLQGRSE